ncbi:MAG TPA: class I SAM-dependent methyltransferase [Chitinophagaceae bacterium]|nr:class I SAM-dependent methyltransferase [Chitinophagaceae bacterium]
MKLKTLVSRLLNGSPKFDSKEYWESRYRHGGNSGAGSYNNLANFKAEVINGLVLEKNVRSIIEFGCGDGNQLSLLQCEQYTGLDVSATAIQICRNKFKDDKSKNFFLYNNQCFVDNTGLFRHECAMSLDVLFHLVEKEVYDTYLAHLFACASRMVIIYAADIDLPQKGQHELYRKFTNDIKTAFPGWKLERVIKNKYPAKSYEDQEGSLADFFIYMPA